MSLGIKRVVAGAALLCAGLFAAAPLRVGAQATTSATTVVLELFTSEGCSSCPPADDVLTDLARRQPLPGVEVLALGEHVDYWDRLGWRDRFSSPAFSARQSEYDARVFRANRIYTPQLVVDGQFELVGSDRGAALDAIRRAAALRKAAMRVSAAQLPDRRQARVDVHVDVPAGITRHGDADVLVAVAENDLVTDVRRGENGGRTLRHSAVVRGLTVAGTLPRDDVTWSTAATVPLGADWNVEHLRVVAFLQERNSRRILGAAASGIAAESSTR